MEECVTVDLTPAPVTLAVSSVLAEADALGPRTGGGTVTSPPYLVFGDLLDAPRLVHGVFTRVGGASPPPYDSLNVSLMVGDDPSRVRENRRRIVHALGGDPAQTFAIQQVHGTAACVVGDGLTPDAIARAPSDILLSGRPGALLLLKFADCVPILLWDARRAWVALAHAGWRGTAANVAGAAVRALRDAAGSDPGDLHAGIGPAIGGCCYEVGEAVASAVAANVAHPTAVVASNGTGKPRLDLAEANRQQLVAAGIPAGQVLTAGRCTYCEVDTFFSHRALGAPAGRFAVVAGVRP